MVHFSQHCGEFVLLKLLIRHACRRATFPKGEGFFSDERLFFVWLYFIRQRRDTQVHALLILHE